MRFWSSRAIPQLRTLRAASLGDTGKFSARDCELVFAACPSLETFECDVGVSAAKVKVDGEYVRGTAERDVAELLAKPQTRVRRMKIHSADAESASEMAVAVAIAAADDRVRSLDVSWGLKLSDGAAAGVADAMERHGRGVPLRRLAMRKANVHDEGAIALAGCIFRAADAVAKHEAAVAEAARVRAKGEDGHRDARAPTIPEHRKPLSRLRWLDLGSNMIGDRGAVAIGDALGPNVPITRLNLRDNAVGMHGCAALGRAAARCVTLRRLDLAHSGFGDAGATALARGFAAAADAERSTSLRVLQLGFNSIGVEGIEALVEAHAAGALDQLEHLDLACNVMGPAGAAALAPMLEPRDDRLVEVEDETNGVIVDEREDEAGVDDVRGRGLYSLDVAVNNVAVDGAREGVRALTRALERNTTLRVLNLRGNDLTPEMAGDVAEMLLENETLRVVNVGYNKIYNEGAWELSEALSENAGLRGLDIQRNEISDDGAAHVRGLLEANEKLSEVDMRSNMLSPETVDEFGEIFEHGSTAGGSRNPRRRTARASRRPRWSRRAAEASPRDARSAPGRKPPRGRREGDEPRVEAATATLAGDRVVGRRLLRRFPGNSRLLFLHISRASDSPVERRATTSASPERLPRDEKIHLVRRFIQHVVRGVLPRHEHHRVESGHLPHRRRAVVSLGVDPAAPPVRQPWVVHLFPLRERRVRHRLFRISHASVHAGEFHEIQSVAGSWVGGPEPQPEVHGGVRHVRARWRGTHSRCNRASSPSNARRYPPWYMQSSRAALYLDLNVLNTDARRCGDVLHMNSPLLKNRK